MSQNYDSINLFAQTTPQKKILQSNSRKLRPEYYQKLFPKTIIFQSNYLTGKLGKVVFPKPTPQTYSPKLPPTRFPAAAAQSCSPKHHRKAVAPKLLCFKPILQSSSPKLFSKAAPESCCLKVSRKAAPQSYCCSPKLLPKPAPQSCSPKPLFKIIIESCSEQLLFQAAPKSCFQKLLPGIVF